MAKKNSIQENIDKMQIAKTYIEYQKFMNVSNMPKYVFVYLKQNGTTLATEIYINSNYNLLIADTLCSTYRNMAKSILFHEFTHILDEEELVNQYGFSHDDRNTPYVYKEIHAEQVRTLFLLGCQCITDVDSIDKEAKTFIHKNKKYSIYEYLIELQKELQSDIEQIEMCQKLNKKIFITDFINILNRVFYYIGTASIYLKYCDSSKYKELDISEIYNFYGGYGINLLLREFVKNEIGYHTKELVEAMGKVRNLIVIKFNESGRLINDVG